jgi:CheY-like chemotaxis protein
MTCEQSPQGRKRRITCLQRRAATDFFNRRMGADPRPLTCQRAVSHAAGDPSPNGRRPSRRSLSRARASATNSEKARIRAVRREGTLVPWIPRWDWRADPSAGAVRGGARRIEAGPALEADGRGRDGRRSLGDDDPVMSAAGGEPARILVVDNDPAINRMVVDYLENRNRRAISASGRQEMARFLAVGKPRLVLLDLRLGRDNGLDLLRETRSRSDIPVIIHYRLSQPRDGRGRWARARRG